MSWSTWRRKKDLKKNVSRCCCYFSPLLCLLALVHWFQTRQWAQTLCEQKKNIFSSISLFYIMWNELNQSKMVHFYNIIFLNKCGLKILIMLTIPRDNTKELGVIIISILVLWPNVYQLGRRHIVITHIKMYHNFYRVFYPLFLHLNIWVRLNYPTSIKCIFNVQVLLWQKQGV